MLEEKAPGGAFLAELQKQITNVVNPHGYLLTHSASLRGADPREETKQSSVYVTFAGILWIASSYYSTEFRNIPRKDGGF